MIAELAAVDDTGTKFSVDLLETKLNLVEMLSHPLFKSFCECEDLVVGGIDFHLKTLMQDTIKRIEESCVQKTR